MAASIALSCTYTIRVFSVSLRCRQGSANDSSPGFCGCGPAGTSLRGGYSNHRLLFRPGTGDWLVSQGPVGHRRRLLHGGPRDDGLDRRTELPVRQPRLAGTDGMGGGGLPVRHPGDALVLDWRDPGDAVPGAGDDAVLLHLQDALGAGLPEAAFRRVVAHACRRFRSPS